MAEKLEIKTKLEEFIKVATDYESIEKSITLTNGEIADKQFCNDLAAIISKAERIAEKCDALTLEITRITDEVAVLEQTADANDNADTLKTNLKNITDRADNLDRKKDTLELDIMRQREKIANAKSTLNLPLIIIGAVILALSAVGGYILSSFVYRFNINNSILCFKTQTRHKSVQKRTDTT